MSFEDGNVHIFVLIDIRPGDSRDASAGGLAI
jgi:hypothetical protein